MDKYLVKPTQIIGDNGLNYNLKDVDQLPAINEVKQRVYDLEIINGAINDRIDTAETNANQAVTEANLAYRMAKDLTDTIEQTSKSASTALENSIEAKENASSLNRDYENIKTRVEVLEGLDGNESINVGPQAMGSYNLNSYTVKWANNTEVRTLAYNPTDTLDQVLDWIHEPLANGLTNHETRISTLENNSGSGESGNCLEQKITIKPYELLSNEQATKLGIDKNQEIEGTAKDILVSGHQQDCMIATMIQLDVMEKLTDHETRIIALENGTVTSPENGTTVVNCSCNVTDHITTVMGSANDMYGYLDYTQPASMTGNNLTDILDQLQSNIDVNKNVIQNHMSKIKSNEATLTSHTNSIQSLDTRTGSHTASIGQLENRMTDVETQTANNKTDISDIKTQIQNLGSGGSSTSSTTNLENDLKKHHYLLNELSNLCSTLERDENLNQDTKDTLLDFIDKCSRYLSECNYQN